MVLSKTIINLAVIMPAFYTILLTLKYGLNRNGGVFGSLKFVKSYVKRIGPEKYCSKLDTDKLSEISFHAGFSK